jgi:hypothetical protein
MDEGLLGRVRIAQTNHVNNQPMERQLLRPSGGIEAFDQGSHQGESK